MLKKLKEQSNNEMTWFQKNHIKMNSDKCNPLISGHKAKQVGAQIGRHKRWGTRRVKLLGITKDSNF